MDLPESNLIAAAAPFDWKKPDYTAVWAARARRLTWIRADKTGQRLAALKAWYRDHPADFINDWGVTLDPKQVERGLPALIPFLLFPKQRAWVEAVVAAWRTSTPLLTEKTRQMGFSWLAMATACTLCLFHPGMAVGFGSRKEEYIDKSGDPKALFYKGRSFMGGLPVEFRGGWTLAKNSTHMRLTFPATEASITGEAGDNIGRGATTSIYFVDESAFLEHPLLTDASLSQTTNCRIDISTPNGMANSFAQKRFGGKIKVFTFHWRDDPRKDDAWYAKQVAELDEMIVAQEIDIDYAASAEGVLLPSAWVQSVVNAHAKLGIAPTGERMASFDVADEGRDNCAAAGAYGGAIEHVEEWSGKGGDIFASTERMFRFCDTYGYDGFKYDADGMGAGVRAAANVINERRRVASQKVLKVIPFRGSEGVFRPEAEDEKGRKNKDFFMNQKAQSWWRVRQRFMKTHRAVMAMALPIEQRASAPAWDPDDIVSLSPNLADLAKVCMELSQPTRDFNTVGKMVIDKTPEGTKSPNLADAVMIVLSRTAIEPMVINLGALGAV
jgi:phage terminase large subunit